MAQACLRRKHRPDLGQATSAAPLSSRSSARVSIRPEPAVSLPALEENLTGIAEQKAALDDCAKGGTAVAVTWAFADGKVREAKITDAVSPKLAKCVASVLRKAKLATSGTCKAVLLFGDPNGAATALVARATPKGKHVRISFVDE